MTCYLIGRWRMNPYQRILAEHLRRAGVDCVESETIPSLRTILRGPHPAVIHFQFLNRLFSPAQGWPTLLKLFLLKRAGIRLFSTLHEVPIPRVWRILYGAALRMHDGLFAFSRFSIDCTVALFPFLPRDRFRMIPHGDFGRFYGGPADPAEARRRLGLPREDFIFLSFGTSAQWKNRLPLVETFSRAAGKRSKLLIAGYHPPAQTERIQRVAGRNGSVILRPDPVADEQVADLFAAADAVLFNYKPCYCSGALNLALDFGKVCVAPGHSYFAENLDPAQGHILYDSSRAGSLAGAIREVSEKQGEIRRRGVITKENGGWKTAARILAACYRGS